jgi:putative peptide zinc metalloprotease protein
MQCITEIVLPELRSDIRLLPGPTAADGSPSWTLLDPARSRYFRINWTAFHIFSNWPAATAQALIDKIHNETTCRLNTTEVLNFIKFLYSNNLTLQAGNADFLAYYQQYSAARTAWTLRILHNYLFFRIPLVRPDPFLRSTLPLVRWCFARQTLYRLTMLALLGLYLVSRQWDVFVGSFLHFFNWQGALCYALAITLAKTLHELGHAYTAVYYGCKVPTMGVAFMALLPIPYTDVTDAWRLNSRRQRVAVGGGGILVELALAIFATLAWSFIPDGELRSAVFVLASSSWVMTLSVNSSPFMRFDGYFMLSDAWGIDNLQARAFALARWRLRRLLFATSENPPESLPKHTEQKLVVYAWLTWAYRLLLFFGIALMVYHYCFKLLGIVLFGIEIVFFIARPIVQEMRAWRTIERGSLPLLRKCCLACLPLLLTFLVLFPWQHTLRLPALLESEQHQTFYAVEPAQLKEIAVKPGARVALDQVLFKLESPKLADEISLSEKRHELYRLRMERAATGSSEAAANRQVSIEQYATEATRLAGLNKQRDRLTIRAPFPGVIVDMQPDLKLGNWVNTANPLATLIVPQRTLVQGLAAEDQATALLVGQSGRFIPEDAFADAIDIQVTDISTINLRELDQPYLASIFGGEVAVKKDAAGKLTPTTALFSVRCAPVEPIAVSRKTRGTLVIEAQARSFIGRWVDGALALLIRESGF